MTRITNVLKTLKEDKSSVEVAVGVDKGGTKLTEPPVNVKHQKGSLEVIFLFISFFFIIIVVIQSQFTDRETTFFKAYDYTHNAIYYYDENNSDETISHWERPEELLHETYLDKEWDVTLDPTTSHYAIGSSYFSNHGCS